MPSYATLMGALSTVVVGGGIAAGVGYAMMPEKKSDVQQTATTNEPIFVPPNFSHTTNYLVLVIPILPKNTTAKTTCTLNTDCQLFSKRSKTLISNEQSSLIKGGNIYVLNTDNASLENNDVVELTTADGKKTLLFVQSKPVKDKSISIAPQQPDNLIDKKALFEAYKNENGPLINQDVLYSKYFYNLQEETYVHRQNINHDSFLILEWKSSSTDISNFQHEVQTTTRVDPYIFKSFAEQAQEQDTNPELIATITYDSEKTFIEIYEIQNEEVIKPTMDALKNKDSNIPQPNWDVLSKENLMLTKLSHLEKGKYYKFVFSNLGELEQAIDRGLNTFKIELKYSEANKQQLLSKSHKEQNYFCAKFTANSGLQNKCDFFKFPEPRE